MSSIVICAADYNKETSVGVVSSIAGSITHYYLDFDGAGNAAMVINWEFTVPESGYYEMCIQMRMKDGKQRGNIVLVDGVEICKMDYQFTDEQVEIIRDNDATLNTRMTGFGTYLTAGEHTLSFKGVPTIVKTFQTRYIYLAKVSN